MSQRCQNPCRLCDVIHSDFTLWIVLALVAVVGALFCVDVAAGLLEGRT